MPYKDRERKKAYDKVYRVKNRERIAATRRLWREAKKAKAN